jgi:hypothetical protein
MRFVSDAEGRDKPHKYLGWVNFVSCKAVPFAVPFVEIYVPRGLFFGAI